MGFELAKKVMRYAEEEFEKAIKLNNIFFHRNVVDKYFLVPGHSYRFPCKSY
jgi:hypothetical protein